MEKKWLYILSFGIIVAVILFYLFGFRITYAPELENDWNAIEAVGTWFGALSPLILAVINAIFTKRIENTKSEISSSNKVIFEHNCEINNQSIEKRIIDYITVSITASTKEIAGFINISVDDTYRILCSLEIKGQIVGVNNRKKVKAEQVIWKKSK